MLLRHEMPEPSNTLSHKTICNLTYYFEVWKRGGTEGFALAAGREATAGRWLARDGYSARKAIIGSTFVARRAGR